ncbi:MAG: AbrB/MazE/SpoVT family DNA-binding domain-containing protein [Chloroflexota bacterium]|nr:AbrB/MazE/SpoVT family DNA-binding domain-containing protein [Chloroflexota bacterium]MDE2883949.1 AbrB/MazE/SpoVT family DNA-binding domain-containing protein [Chloroflexota bacterium]
MLAKLTSKNQITLPKAIISAFKGTEYFDVTQEEGRIVLAPMRVTPAKTWSLADAEAYVEKMRRLRMPLDTTDPEVWLERMNTDRSEAIWEKMDRLGITEQDIADAIEWARRG